MNSTGIISHNYGLKKGGDIYFEYMYSYICVYVYICTSYINVYVRVYVYILDVYINIYIYIYIYM